MGGAQRVCLDKDGPERDDGHARHDSAAEHAAAWRGHLIHPSNKKRYATLR